jgi:hypothetical protein
MISWLSYLLQGLVVFLIPAYFGWNVLRQLVREHNLLILTPGSIVLGWAALMALANELRFVCEQPQALWFSYKSLLGWRLGVWLETAGSRLRWAAGGVLACCLVNPLALGLFGLMPSTVAVTVKVSESGSSLSAEAGATTAGDPTPPRSRDFEQLTRQAGDFLHMMERSRSRVALLVPENELPPQPAFHEWMKLPTLDRVQLPIGWHWHDSPYVAHYRRANATLDARALAALGAGWIMETDVFGYSPTPAVREALQDPTRFIKVSTYRTSSHSLSLYRCK